MENNSKKSRQGLALGLSIVAIVVWLSISASSNSSPSNSSNSQAQPAAAIDAFAPATPEVQAAPVQTVQSDPQPADTQPVQSEQESDLSNNHYYSNSSGNTVHAPAYDLDNDVPAGASAKCGDGTYSFSEHRSGTCSHHRGVSSWLH